METYPDFTAMKLYCQAALVSSVVMHMVVFCSLFPGRLLWVYTASDGAYRASNF